MNQDKTPPTPPLDPPPLEGGDQGGGAIDPIRATLSDSAQQGLSPEVDFDDLPAPLPPLDSGDSPPDSTAALPEGAEVDFDELPEPLPELDEGPPPGPLDEIQGALFGAALSGAKTEVDLDDLPPPGPPPAPQKVYKSKQGDSKPLPPVVETTRPARPSLSPAEQPAFSAGDWAALATDFRLILALFIVFRLLTLWLLRPGGFIRDWSDFDTYFGIAGLSDYGLYPFLDFWLEWPPLVPWLAVGAYKLALLLPPWPDDPRLWFIIILGTVFVLFEIGNFILIYRLARRLISNNQLPITITRTLWLYAGLFPPLYALLGFFDGVALFFILLALDLLLVERRLQSAVAVGAGFMVKIIPILLLPVALRRLWHLYRHNRQEAQVELGLYAVVAGLTIIVLLAPFLIGGPQWVRAGGRSMLERSSWETVWAVAEGYYGFGQVAGDRLNPAETHFAVHPASLPWWLISLGFAALYGLLLLRPADYSRPHRVVALAGLTIALFLLYAKGYSPQFLVYLLPFIILLLPDGRGLSYALILTGLNVLEQPIYFVLLPNQGWLLTFIVISRFLVTLLVAFEFAALIWPVEERWPTLWNLQRQLPKFLAIAAGGVLLVLLPVLAQAYQAERLGSSPVATFVNFITVQTRSIENIQPGPGGKPRLLLSDQSTYRQLYPYLSRDFDLQLTDGAAKRYPGAPRIIDLLQGLDTIWVLPTGPQQQTLSNAVSGRGQPLATFTFDGLGAASLYGLRENIQPFIAPARFSNGIELLAHEVKVERGAVEVTLFWRALSQQSQSYKVFTQLLDESGQRVAGHDGIPANGTAPTDAWPVGAVQADTHRIELPPGLSAGTYRLITGLYNNFDERLLGIDRKGVSFANRAVPLESVRLP